MTILRVRRRMLGFQHSCLAAPSTCPLGRILGKISGPKIRRLNNDRVELNLLPGRSDDSRSGCLIIRRGENSHRHMVAIGSDWIGAEHPCMFHRFCHHFSDICPVAGVRRGDSHSAY